MRDEVILIGPVGAGKSTQGRLLAERLELPQYSMDELRWNYYDAAGYNDALARRIWEAGGFMALYWYWKPFEIDSLERLLAEHHDCVFDLGAGHSVYEHSAFFERAERALAPFRHVVLLLPSPDETRSIEHLRLRARDTTEIDSPFDFIAHFVRHRSNRALAKHVVYTEDKSLEETRDEILLLVARQTRTSPQRGNE
jgi:shikimate kinase